MRYFLDTEFSENGPGKPIRLISIGIIAEDGREFYAVSADFSDNECNDWVQEHVLPNLGDVPRNSLRSIGNALITFCDRAQFGKPEFWGYYADYDWVVTAQIFGAMVNLPKDWPMYCNDIKQLAVMLGNPKLPNSKVEHHALEDARWNKQAFDFLWSLIPPNLGSTQGHMLIGFERLRQIGNEGYSAHHDDKHNTGQLVAAAVVICSDSHV